MLPQIQEFLLNNWESLPLERPKPQDLSFLVRGTGVGKLCCYVFADDEPYPRWVVKVPRSPKDNSLLASEYDLVHYLRKNGGEHVRATVPEPLLTATIAGHLIGVEPCLRGSSLDGLLVLAPSRMDELLDLGISWLLRCQQEVGAHPQQLSEGQIEAHFARPIELLSLTAQLTLEERAFLEDVLCRVRQMARVPLPLVFRHGDFRPANILLDGQAIHVLDWEFGVPASLPLMDVFGYLARVHARSVGLEEIDGYLEDYLVAFDEVFIRGGSFAGRTARWVEQAGRALGVEVEWLDILLAMFLVTEANKYHAFLHRRASRGYVYLMRRRGNSLPPSYEEQLARQKNVWLLGHLAARKELTVFNKTARSQWLPMSSVRERGVQVG